MAAGLRLACSMVVLLGSILPVAFMMQGPPPPPPPPSLQHGDTFQGFNFDRFSLDRGTITIDDKHKKIPDGEITKSKDYWMMPLTSGLFAISLAFLLAFIVKHVLGAKDFIDRTIEDFIVPAGSHSDPSTGNDGVILDSRITAMLKLHALETQRAAIETLLAGNPASGDYRRDWMAQLRLELKVPARWDLMPLLAAGFFSHLSITSMMDMWLLDLHSLALVSVGITAVSSFLLLLCSFLIAGRLRNPWRMIWAVSTSILPSFGMPSLWILYRTTKHHTVASLVFYAVGSGASFATRLVLWQPFPLRSRLFLLYSFFSLAASVTWMVFTIREHESKKAHAYGASFGILGHGAYIVWFFYPPVLHGAQTLRDFILPAGEHIYGRISLVYVRIRDNFIAIFS